MRVVQLIPNLVGGGAEAVVRTLGPGLAAAGIDLTIVSIYPSGLDEAELRNLGVPVVDLGRSGRGDRGYFPRLVRTLRELRPDVVHAHLHTGQYGGRAAALLARVPAIVLPSTARSRAARCAGLPTACCTRERRGSSSSPRRSGSA